MPVVMRYLTCAAQNHVGLLDLTEPQLLPGLVLYEAGVGDFVLNAQDHVV